ncbi:MAG: NAD-dependent epimerase/dehydratase family protein [Magnetococcus sp. YQC-5]
MKINNAQDVLNVDLNYIIKTCAKECDILAGKHILLTGGAGFLGYYLVLAIQYWNRQIADPMRKIRLSIYDHLGRGAPRWLDDVVSSDSYITLQKYDITHPLPDDVPSFDYIMHAASIASPIFYRQNPIATMDANVNGLRNLLNYAVRRANQGQQIKGFLYFSSSEIYGDPTPENIPTPETYWGNVSCTGPRACYDESKRFGETMCVNFVRQHGLHITIARPFNNYGPGLKITDKRVLPDFARDIIHNRDIVMYSDGTATRTFCYVADAIIGYIKVLIKGESGKSYNIGTDNPEISISGVGKLLIDISREFLGYNGKLVKYVNEDKDYLVDNPNRRCPIIDRARNELGFEPCIDLEEGLKRMMLWYNENRDEGIFA